MKFKELRAKNFGPFKDEVVLQLADQGMVLITGENLDEYDSNGAGKSTLLEAFVWCLWGKNLRDIGVDDVINRFAGQDCQVTVTFEDDAEYVVTRTRGMTGGKKANDLVFTVNGVDATTGGMKLTQERIEKSLGLDFNTFRAMMPGTGLKAAEMTDKSIKELLEDLLQTRVIAEAMELAKVEVKRLDLQIKSVDGDIQRLNVARDEEYARYETYAREDKSFDENKEKRIWVIQTEVSEQMKIVDDAEKVAKKWKIDKAKLDEHKVKHAAAVEARVKAAETSKALCADRLAWAQRYDKQIDQLNGEASILRKVMRKAYDVSAICTACQQNVSEGHRHRLVSEAEAAVKAVEDKVDQLVAERDREIAQLTEVITSAYKKVDDCEAVEVALQLRIAELAKGETEFKIATERWKTAKARIKQLSEQQEKVQAETSPFKALMTASADKIDRLTKEGGQLVIERTAHETERNEYAFWVDGFSAAGLRSYMLEHVTPVLNSRAAYYSELVTAGNMVVTFNTKTTLESGEVREKFNIEVDQKYGGRSYGACSAGEKARADLIVAFALGDLASLRANKIVPFRFLDEPFESVDDSGTEAVVRLLNDQREKYNTVYVITHKDHFKQLFKNRLTVTKKDGCSTLEYKHGE